MLLLKLYLLSVLIKNAVLKLVNTNNGVSITTNTNKNGVLNTGPSTNIDAITGHISERCSYDWTY